MKKKVTMKQVCKQVVVIDANTNGEAIKKVMQGQGTVIENDFDPGLRYSYPDSWEVEDII